MNNITKTFVTALLAATVQTATAQGNLNGLGNEREQTQSLAERVLKLEKKSDAFTAYEKARIRAFEFYKKGENDQAVQDEVVKIITDYSGKETDYVKTYLYGGVTKYSTDPNATGIVKYVDAAVKSGALSSAAIDFGTYDIKQNINTDNYEKALKELIEENKDNEFYADLLKKYEEANKI
jgi:hypothetical protein